MVFGCMQVVKIGFSFATFAILLFHVVVNIYKRFDSDRYFKDYKWEFSIVITAFRTEHTFAFIRNRNAAVKNINRLSKADIIQLRGEKLSY